MAEFPVLRRALCPHQMTAAKGDLLRAKRIFRACLQSMRELYGDEGAHASRKRLSPEPRSLSDTHVTHGLSHTGTSDAMPRVETRHARATRRLCTLLGH